MSNYPRRWPWERKLPDPITEELALDTQRRLAEAEAALAEGQQQHASAQQQASKANRFIRGLTHILDDNHIGPAIESTFRSHRHGH